MRTNNLNVNVTVEKQELDLLKIEKEQLEGLRTKIEKSKDELVSSNLSGKTYEACITNNEMFYNLINNRIATIESLISKLEYACNSYTDEWYHINESVGGTEVNPNTVE